MAQIQPLTRAPIVEALIDFRVQVGQRIAVDQLERAADAPGFGYHKKSPILRGTFGFVVNPQDSPMAKPLLGAAATIGVRFHSADERYVAQFTTEGFTLSRLAPYESWEALIREARRVWAVYRDCAAPTRIQRTATRFINNLRLPLKPGERFDLYLNGLPNLPPEYPQSISSFLQRFVVHDDVSGANAILTQALEQFPLAPPVPVMLDIDVFRECRFEPDGTEVWDFLTDLRQLKNRCFFGALSNDAVKLYR
ncbi:MAG: TIGR04255 family protein [Steroidobacteraceae bacterium]